MAEEEKLKDRLEKSLVWFALGIIFTAIVTTAGFFLWIENRIASLTPGHVEQALSQDRVKGLVDTHLSDAFGKIADIRADAKEAERLVAAIELKSSEAERRLASFPRLTQKGGTPPTATSNATAGIPEGAVMAFDAERCPSGWAAFQQAGGRFIIGSGLHENKDVNGLPLKAFKTGLSGGEAVHALTIDEMPKHTHQFSIEAGAKIPEKFPDFWLSGTGSTYNFEFNNPSGPQANVGGLVLGIAEAGGSQAHNNMPPYVALYFCKKEAE